MDRDEFMELVYETFADEPDNVLANGIIEAADAYVEYEKAQLSKQCATSDLISRQAAIDAFEDTTFTKNEIRRRLSDLPSVQPERKKGKWKMEPDPYGFFEKIPVCSECGCTTEMRKAYKFCPNCGADMRGEKDG